MKILIDQNKITIAFNNPFPFPEDDLETELKTKDYVVPKEPTMISVGPDGGQSIVKRWEREEVGVYYDSNKGFLSSEGKDFKKVSAGFEDIREIAKNLLGSDLTTETEWAEVLFNCRCLGDKRPLKAFEDYLPSQPYLKFEEIGVENLKPFSLKMYSAEESELEGPLNKIPNWVHINIEPLIINPKYYYIRVVYRQVDISKVGVFSTKLKEVVESLINHIESDSDVSTD